MAAIALAIWLLAGSRRRPAGGETCASSRPSDTNIKAQSGPLMLLANRMAADFDQNSPPTELSQSRATQSPALLRPMANSGIASLRIVPSGRCGECDVDGAGGMSLSGFAVRRNFILPPASAAAEESPAAAGAKVCSAIDTGLTEFSRAGRRAFVAACWGCQGVPPAGGLQFRVGREGAAARVPRVGCGPRYIARAFG